MNGIVFHIVSGHAFFTGIALLVTSALTADISSNPLLKRLCTIGLAIGMIAIVLCSTPVPFWGCVVTALCTFAWIAARFRKRRQRFTTVLFSCSCILAALFELPWHLIPTLDPVSSRSITIIGDSVTSGTGGKDESITWPSLMADQHHLNVQDISHVGETASSALTRIMKHEINSQLIVVEIGGNDVLGGTKASQFGADLRALLQHLTQGERQVLMLELPLPPFCQEFSRQQRLAALKYDVPLVPKRVFLSVLAAPGSTVDSIHLSQSGHHRMADSLWPIVRRAFDNSSDQRADEVIHQRQTAGTRRTE